jgi:superfamily II DNA/RNA helicase
LAPTRELAQQIEEEAVKFGKVTKILKQFIAYFFLFF